MGSWNCLSPHLAALSTWPSTRYLQVKLEQADLDIDWWWSGFKKPGPVRWKVKSDRTDHLRTLISWREGCRGRYANKSDKWMAKRVDAGLLTKETGRCAEQRRKEVVKRIDAVLPTKGIEGCEEQDDGVWRCCQDGAVDETLPGMAGRGVQNGGSCESKRGIIDSVSQSPSTDELSALREWAKMINFSFKRACSACAHSYF